MIADRPERPRFIVLLTALALAGASAALLSDTVLAGPSSSGPADGITAIELARWIRDGRRDVRLLDVRSAAEYEADHIPTAANIPASSLSAASFEPGVTVVLYDEGLEGDHAASRARDALQREGVAGVQVLKGGLIAWANEVLQPTRAADATPAEKRAFEEVAEISRWFGGLPRVEPAGAPKESPLERARAVRRRAC